MAKTPDYAFQAVAWVMVDYRHTGAVEVYAQGTKVDEVILSENGKEPLYFDTGPEALMAAQVAAEQLADRTRIMFERQGIRSLTVITPKNDVDKTKAVH